MAGKWNKEYLTERLLETYGEKISLVIFDCENSGTCGKQTKLKFFCNEHGNEFVATPHNVMIV